MPANSSGWPWHHWAIQHGLCGHLYSPRAQRGPWKWFPYALDNGAFSCWDPKTNTFDDAKWVATEAAWRELLFWAQAAPQAPRWAIVPDVPGNRAATIERWQKYAHDVKSCGIPLAVAVQDGMTPDDVAHLVPAADVVAVGGSTEWKWRTVETWAANFPRVHLLRCNAPDKLDFLKDLGVESCDGTGWNRGDRAQTAGLEDWFRRHSLPTFRNEAIWPHVARAVPKHQLTFA